MGSTAGARAPTGQHRDRLASGRQPEVRVFSGCNLNFFCPDQTPTRGQLVTIGRRTRLFKFGQARGRGPRVGSNLTFRRLPVLT